MNAAARKDIPLKRIRDLQRMCESPNQHEASVARLRLDELLARYRLTERDLVEEAVETARLTAGKDGNQRQELARVVAQSRGCSPQYGRDLAFKGYPEAAKDACELFCALVRIAEDSADLPRDHYRPDSDRFLWRTCFWLGFVEAVEKQLDPEHATVPKQALGQIIKATQAPPVIERAAKAFEGLRNRLSDMGADRAHDAAEAFKTSAHAAGFELASCIPIPSYRKGRR